MWSKNWTVPVNDAAILLKSMRELLPPTIDVTCELSCRSWLCHHHRCYLSIILCLWIEMSGTSRMSWCFLFCAEHAKRTQSVDLIFFFFCSESQLDYDCTVTHTAKLARTLPLKDVLGLETCKLWVRETFPDSSKLVIVDWVCFYLLKPCSVLCRP